jgi:phosphoenolpyruvate carboxylase
MCQRWPFFSVRIAMLEMVYAKTDRYLAQYYDQKLVSPELWPLGESLRSELQHDIEAVLSITNDGDLMQDLPWSRRTVELRNIYTDPLNILQTELLARHRANSSPEIDHALMITIGGIAAGMRNTG